MVVGREGGHLHNVEEDITGRVTKEANCLKYLSTYFCEYTGAHCFVMSGVLV